MESGNYVGVEGKMIGGFGWDGSGKHV